MNAKTAIATVLVAAFTAVCGAAAAQGLSDAHCGTEFDTVQVGGGFLNGYVLHSQMRGDDTLANGVTTDILDIEINVPVPNKLPGFHTWASALDTSFTLTFRHGRSNAYARCYVHANLALELYGQLNYAMRIENRNGKIIWHGGVCDVEPWTDGMQPGVPLMYLDDSVTTYVVADDEMTMVTSGRVHAH